MIRIRLADEADAGAVAAIYAPFVQETAVSFEEVPPSREDIARRIAETTRTYPWLVCEQDGGVAGYAYATQHRVRAAYRWAVDTSVYVGAAHHRRGIARGLYTSLFEVLRAQGFVNAYAGITLPNARSVGLHEAVGFTRVGVYRQVGYKLGAWHDVGWWQLPLQPHPRTPAEPVPLSVVLGTPAWARAMQAGEALVRGAPA